MWLLQRVDDETGQGLRVDVRALLGHEVSLRRDRDDVAGRRRLQEQGDRSTLVARLDPRDGLRLVVRIRDPRALGDGVGVDSREAFDGDPGERDVEASKRPAARGK
jgi:hypothetical protein